MKFRFVYFNIYIYIYIYIYIIQIKYIYYPNELLPQSLNPDADTPFYNHLFLAAILWKFPLCPKIDLMW